MSITSEDRIAGPFASGTVLPFDFKVFEASDLRVIKTEADGTVLPDLTSPTDFSVVLNPDQDDDAGGEVTLVSAISGGASVVVTSQVPNTQPNTITNLGGFLPATLNGAFDRLCIQIQQLSTYINAALRFPLSDGGEGSAALPPAVLRAGQVLMFDANGDATVGSPSSALVSAPMQPVVAAASLAAARTALGVPVIPYTDASAAGSASLDFAEDTDNGVHKVSLKAPAALPADADIILPTSGTLATLTGGEALTNKSVNGVTLTTGGSASEFLNGAGSYALPEKKVVQRVYTQTGAVATGTTVMPYDDTIPQITEGNEYMTLSITPTSASSILVIEIQAILGISTGNRICMALFQDATANALAADNAPNTTGPGAGARLVHNMVAGTTSATTFRFRAGPSAAATITFNGNSGARVFGGVAASSISITEYAA